MIPGDTRERSETSHYASVKSILHGLTKRGISAGITMWSSGDLLHFWLKEHRWPLVYEIGIRSAKWLSQGAYVGTKTNSEPSAPPKHAGPVYLIVLGEEAAYPRVSESRGVSLTMRKVQSCGAAYCRFSDEC